MAERLTLKMLSGELEALRTQVQQLEQQLERKLEATLEAAAGKLKSRLESSEMKQHGATINAEHHRRLIAEEAYLIAERRGFEGGDSAKDWIEAEQVVNHRLMQQSAPEKSVKRSAKKPAASKSETKTTSRIK